MNTKNEINRLPLFTLMYLGYNRDKLVTIQVIADLHGISKNHLIKVVRRMGLSGMVETETRGSGLKRKREGQALHLTTQINARVMTNRKQIFFVACYQGRLGLSFFKS